MTEQDHIDTPPEVTTLQGVIHSVRGGVVDIVFSDELPAINSLIFAGENDGVAIETVAHLDENAIRHLEWVQAQRGKGLVTDCEYIQALELGILDQAPVFRLGRFNDEKRRPFFVAPDLSKY